MKKTLQQKYPPCSDAQLDERTKKANELFKLIVSEANKRQWQYVVLSGFAIDAYLGYFSRNHKDVDFIIDRSCIDDVVIFLEKIGHVVCVSKGHGDDLLRVDPIDRESTRAAHADIHISYFDHVSNETVIPMHGKEIRFYGNYRDISTDRQFQGVMSKVLLPRLLIEEKKGWTEMIGLEGRDERNQKEIEKIHDILLEY